MKCLGLCCLLSHLYFVFADFLPMLMANFCLDVSVSKHSLKIKCKLTCLNSPLDQLLCVHFSVKVSVNASGHPA